MSVFENFTKKVTETAKAAAKKSGDLVEVTKLNMNISNEEGKIEKAYEEIGKLVYESFKRGEEVAEAFRGQCELIRSYEEVISEMKQKILELKSVKICPSCGSELALDVAFCSKCGAKQEMPQPQVAEEPAEKVCPSCSEVNTPDAAFCAKCGAKM